MTYPKHSKYKIPHFDQYACFGDTVTWAPKQNNPHGLMITARLECDTDTKPNDSECYSEKKISEWHNGDWHYVGVVLSVHKDNVTLDNHVVSIWGLECNYSTRGNLYFAQVCKDLESEVLQVVADVLSNLTGKE